MERSFHSHDFEWKELAVKCEVELMQDKKERENIDTLELSKLAQQNWNEFHARNNGIIHVFLRFFFYSLKF